MEKSIFIKIFKEQLESDDVQLELNTKLSEIKGWDSLSTMLVVSEFNDEFENLYKGQISKSGVAILPSKRTRRIPEVKKPSLADEALSELKAEQPEIKEENLETEEAPLELSEEAPAAEETPAATEEENKSE